MPTDIEQHKGFTVQDRRGMNVVDEVAEITHPAPAAKAADGTEKHFWFDVDYVLVPVPQPRRHPNEPMIVIINGRAIGKRNDDKVFLIDYPLYQVVTDKTLDWRPIAKNRLDTFLDCECTYGKHLCGLHTVRIPAWLEEDQQRFAREQARGAPPALKAIMMADEALQARPKIIPALGGRGR